MREKYEPCMATGPMNTGGTMSSIYPGDHPNPRLPNRKRGLAQPHVGYVLTGALNRGSILSDRNLITNSEELGLRLQWNILSDHWMEHILSNRPPMCVWIPGFECVNLN